MAGFVNDMLHPDRGAVERCSARIIRRHLSDGCLQLEAHSEESLQQRIMQLSRDAFALPLAFVKPHTEFPMEMLALDVPTVLLDDPNRPVATTRHKSAIDYIRGSINTAVHDLLSLPIPEPVLWAPDQFGRSLQLERKHAAVQWSFELARCTISVETRRLAAIRGRNPGMHADVISRITGPVVLSLAK